MYNAEGTLSNVYILYAVYSYAIGKKISEYMRERKLRNVIEPPIEFMTNDFLFFFFFFRSSSINRSYMEEYRSIMIPNTYRLRGMELPQRTTDASEFLRAWHRQLGLTMLEPVLGISTVWWLVVYASILLLLSPLVLIFIVLLPNFPILLLRRMCYIPIESIWQIESSILRDRTSLNHSEFQC